MKDSILENDDMFNILESIYKNSTKLDFIQYEGNSVNQAYGAIKMLNFNSNEIYFRPSENNLFRFVSQSHIECFNENGNIKFELKLSSLNSAHLFSAHFPTQIHFINLRDNERFDFFTDAFTVLFENISIADYSHRKIDARLGDISKVGLSLFIRKEDAEGYRVGDSLKIKGINEAGSFKGCSSKIIHLREYDEIYTKLGICYQHPVDVDKAIKELKNSKVSVR